MARAFHFDQAIKNYLQRYPNGKIVNLGAGLETAFFRVDNQMLTWIDLDLPEVISLREKLLPQSKRIDTIAKSILDYSWIDDVSKRGGEFFFFAGGLLIYFNEEEIKSIMNKMANRFPRSEFCFDVISEKRMHHANKVLAQSHMADAVMKWSLDDAMLLERWSPHIKVINQIKYFHDIKLIKGFPLSLRLRMFFYDLMSEAQIVYLKFK